MSVAELTGAETLVDAASMSLTELADHIERTHHVHLDAEFVRLDDLTAHVASAHGDKDARLREVRSTFLTLAAELSEHMTKEERVLFPMVRQLEANETAPRFHCGSLANPVRQMEREHVDAGSALARLRTLTDAFVPPEWACEAHRALLASLSAFERDMHQHIHKETDVLFPRALEMERQKRRH